MKKLVFSFILILICLISVSVCAESEVFSYPFTSEKDSKAWYGCFYDESLPFGDGYSAFVTNPFGEVKNDTVTHVIDYSGKIHLEAGKIYTLSGYVMNPLNDRNEAIRASANLESNANTIIVTVSGADSEWDRYSTTFYAGETGDFNLSIHFTHGNIDFGFFIDEIVLEETSFTLSSLGVKGPSEVLIPIGSTTKVNFVPYIIASDSTEINILSTGNIVSSCSKSIGVEYNPNSFTLTVTGDAVAYSVLTIDFALKNYANLSPYTHTVTLTDNMIKNSSLEEDELLWTSSSEIVLNEEQGDTFISLATNDYGDFGYFSTLTYDSPQLLLEGDLYVVRARVKSDVEIPVSSIYAKNIAYTLDNTVFFNISDIPAGEWTEVFSAFVPDTSGIYTISINLCSTYDCNVFIDDIRLCTEVPRPEYVTLHAPGNISIPDVQTSYPVSALLRDQLGNIIPTDNITISLTNENPSLQFNSDTNILTVFPDTLSGEYIFSAYYTDNTDITASLPVTVSLDYVGDGGFETKVTNEWWMVTSPYICDFYIRNDGFSKRALVNCIGDYFILLNNSYVNLTKRIPYVFNGEFSCAVDCTVTLFLEALDSEIYPLAQFHLPGGTTLDEKLPPALFLAEENITGRLLLYVQSDNLQPFSMYADNLSLKKAFVMAGNLHLEGSTTVNNAAEARFSFYNSVAMNDDTSSCIVNWYVAASPDSTFTIVDTYGKNIYFDTTFLNKYIYFEVIPVCPLTGFSGDAVRSSVFKVTYSDEFFDSAEKNFTLPSLASGDQYDHFTDTENHWANDIVNQLAASGIIHGKTQDIFSPDENISRAEFAKLISTSFSVRPQSNFSQFEDIRKSDWFYAHVCTLNLAGIVNGTSETAFSPNQPIRREDAVVMLMRIYEKFAKIPAPATISFLDGDRISQYAYPCVNAAQKLGIVLGNGHGKFYPRSYITRAEAAALLHRMVLVLSAG